jgi:hypothetical protein
MFDAHKHLERRLRKNGARGMADITVAQLPVLFDPHDHDKICVDHERIQQCTAGTGVRVQVMPRADGSVRTVHPGEHVTSGVRTVELGPDGSIRITTAPQGDAGGPPSEQSP